MEFAKKRKKDEEDSISFKKKKKKNGRIRVICESGVESWTLVSISIAMVSEVIFALRQVLSYDLDVLFRT